MHRCAGDGCRDCRSRQSAPQESAGRIYLRHIALHVLRACQEALSDFMAWTNSGLRVANLSRADLVWNREMLEQGRERLSIQVRSWVFAFGLCSLFLELESSGRLMTELSAKHKAQRRICQEAI